MTTSRLLLRPFALDDVDAAYTVLEGHPDVWKFDPGFQRTREQRAALIRFAFDALRLVRLVTITQPHNTPSIHLLERLGIRIEPAPPKWADSVMATLENDRRS